MIYRMAAENLVKNARRCSKCGIPVISDDPKAAMMVAFDEPLGSGDEAMVRYTILGEAVSPAMCDDCRKA